MWCWFFKYFSLFFTFNFKMTYLNCIIHFYLNLNFSYVNSVIFDLNSVFCIKTIYHKIYLELFHSNMKNLQKGVILKSLKPEFLLNLHFLCLPCTRSGDFKVASCVPCENKKMWYGCLLHNSPPETKWHYIY